MPASPSCSSIAGASLTPPEDAGPAAVERLAAFWRALGANVETMSAEHHDLVLGITSHLPHLIAYTIVGTADELSQVTRSEVLKFSAGGFRDFTRIAASDPTMWRDVFLANKDAVLEMLGRFNEDLSTLTRAIRRGDGETLFDHFTRTRAIRRGIVEIGQDSPAPDFGLPAAARAAEQRRTTPTWNGIGGPRDKPCHRRSERGTPPPACHRARYAGRAPRPGRAPRSGARSSLQARNQPIERAQRRTDLPLRHDAVDLEHLEDLLDPDHRHLQIAVEAAARGEPERAGADRDHDVLLAMRALMISTGRRRACHSVNRRPRLWARHRQRRATTARSRRRSACPPAG